jgi:uncharacterized RDD family membrane protein YckC
MGAAAGWYPDPDGSGGQRYFDGRDWTGHRAPPLVYWGPPPWKGALLGRPAVGPGALADPGRRLGARALDGAVLLPAAAAFIGIAIAIAAPLAGPLFPRQPQDTGVRGPTPGVVWIYLAVFVAVVATGLVAVAYETVATARYGRTLGKAWLHIRPVAMDGGPVGWGPAFGRVALYFLSGVLGWLGAIDPLWCLWDANRQCLHDKAAGTLVVND